MGIAEQNVVGIAAGLANGGQVPFVCCASCFLTARAMEQIKADVAYSNANVKLCGMSSGLAYGALGATHHSIEDVAWMRALANMTVIVPADPLETEQAVREAARMVGPVFLRVSRMPVPAVHGPDYVFQIGRASDCARQRRDAHRERRDGGASPRGRRAPGARGDRRAGAQHGKRAAHRSSGDPGGG